MDDRVIDLSRAAANRLNIPGPGTARVRVQSLGGVERMKEDGDLTGAFYVQVGAFADRINADNLISILSQSGKQGRLILRQQQYVECAGGAVARFVRGAAGA